MTNPQNTLPSSPENSGAEVSIAVSSQEPQTAAETAHMLRPGAMEEQRPLWQALQESEERFQATFEQTAVGLAHISPEGKWLRINQKLCSITGYTKSELSEKTLPEITFAADAKAEQQHTRQLLAGQIKTYAAEKCLVHKNGSLTWVKQTTSLAADAEGAARYFIMVVEDINAYRRLAAAKEQAQARQEFEYKELERRKDEFISMASHEMKTPITTIKAFAQYLQRTFEKQGLKEPAEYLAKMDAQINKLTRLIADLLDISKIQAGKLALAREPFDMHQLVSNVAAEVRQGNPDYTITIEGHLPKEMVGDRGRLGQVLINLLTNAIKYSPGANRVDVQLAIQAQDRVVISVRDYGIGISSQHQEKIFERYYRAYDDESKTYPGLGFGLYISSEIIKLHGGTLWVDSVEGQGSTFRFSVPIL